MIQKKYISLIIMGFLTFLIIVRIPTAQDSIFKLYGDDLEQKIMTRFTLIFYSELDRANAYITYDSWKIISNILMKGAKNLANSKLTPESLKIAELNIKRFALAAITFAEKQPSGELRIGESTWGKMKNTICPLWPVC